MVKAMKRLGVNIGTCGVQTVRLRPMLIFEEEHGKSEPGSCVYGVLKLTNLIVPILVGCLDKVLGNL